MSKSKKKCESRDRQYIKRKERDKSPTQHVTACMAVLEKLNNQPESIGHFIYTSYQLYQTKASLASKLIFLLSPLIESRLGKRTTCFSKFSKCKLLRPNSRFYRISVFSNIL